MFPMEKGTNKLGDLESRFQTACDSRPSLSAAHLGQILMQDDSDITMCRFKGHTELVHMSLHF